MTGSCSSCGAVGVVRPATFRQNIGKIFMRESTTLSGSFCSSCMHKHFWKFSLTTAAVGWLGTISALLTPCFLTSNASHYTAFLCAPVLDPLGIDPNKRVYAGAVAIAVFWLALFGVLTLLAR